MPLITETVPQTWQELEIAVRDILAECGMDAQRQVQVPLVRGAANVDVLATFEADGITSKIICECKHWDSNIPQDVVHGFQTVIGGSGANHGFVISRRGFQAGAFAAVANTNIELLTFAQFQERFFQQWYKTQLWAMEQAVGGFNTYYEPLGIPGLNDLLEAGDQEGADAYLAVWHRYLFAGLMIQRFSPYQLAFGTPAIELPVVLNVPEGGQIAVPDDVQGLTSYRELFQKLTAYGVEGRAELRSRNPRTRGRPDDEVGDAD